MHDKVTNSLLQAALAYATANPKHPLKLFPVKPGEKKSRVAAEYAKDRAKWGMTNDPRLIKSYWHKWPDSNIGLPTGEVNGFFVVDVDTVDGHANLNVDGKVSLDKLIAEHGDWPETRTVRSPSGSHHYYFSQPPGRTVKNSSGELGEGIDVRGNGGMVIAPPSVNPKYPDRFYEVINPGKGIVTAPQWLLDIVCEEEGASHQSGDAQAPIEKLHAAMQIIPNDHAGVVWSFSDPDDPFHVRETTGFDGWARIGLALFRATGGSDEGFAIFDEWSAKNSDKYDRALTHERWHAKFASSPPSRVGAGTLFMLANDEQPNWSRDWDREHAAEYGETSVIRIAAGEEEANALKAQRLLIDAGAEIYQFSGRLVRPIVEEVDASDERKTTIVRIRPVINAVLNLELCRHVRFEKYDARSKMWKRIRADDRTTLDILAQEGRWRFQRIAGVITTPTLRPDGTILSTPGHDPKTGLLLLSPPPMPPIPERPTREDALAALADLKTLQAEFPFEDDVSRSVGLSGLITPVVRGAFPVTPAHSFVSAVAGSGKSFYNDVIACIATGKLMPVMSATIGNDEETSKRLTAALSTGQPLISLDNVNGDLGGDLLCQAIERSLIHIRPFGKNTEVIEIEARGTSIFMTGNNLTLVGDLNRRVLTGRLDPRMEQPELREFSGNPVQEVLRDRGRYVAACLTICRAYVVAGRPEKQKPLASFEGWSDCVRSALIWLGEEDPVKSIQNTRTEDPERIVRQEMLSAWADLFGTGAGTAIALKAAIKRADLEVSDFAPGDLRCLFSSIAPARDGLGGIDEKRLIYWFRKNKGKIIDRRRFANVSGHAGYAQWFVEEV